MAESSATPRISKADLVADVFAQFDGKPITKSLTDELLSCVAERIRFHLAKGAEVNWYGLGTWKRSVRAAGVYRNPSTQETIKKPRSRVPRFRPALAVRAAVAFPAQAKAMTAKPAPVVASPPPAKPVKPSAAAKASAPASGSTAKTAKPAAVQPPPVSAKPKPGRPAKVQAAEMPPPAKASAKEKRVAAQKSA